MSAQRAVQITERLCDGGRIAFVAATQGTGKGKVVVPQSSGVEGFRKLLVRASVQQYLRPEKVVLSDSAPCSMALTTCRGRSSVVCGAVKPRFIPESAPCRARPSSQTLAPITPARRTTCGSESPCAPTASGAATHSLISCLESPTSLGGPRFRLRSQPGVRPAANQELDCP